MIFIGNDDVGNYVNAGLPNITGEVITSNNSWFTGCFYYTGRTIGGAGGNYGDRIAGFDASLSNPIYGNNDTVQQSGIGCNLYMFCY